MNKLCVIAVTVLLSACVAANGRQRHAFYRSVRGGGGGGRADGRRVFGGAAAALRECPAACALLDARGAVRCSGAVLRAHWALTAAHCVGPHVAYVKYNSRRPAAAGNVSAVLRLYRHPNYEVEQKDEGRGLDVTRLHHDVGLVRTRDAMAPAAFALRRHPARLLYGEEVQVFGFGRTERSALGEELFSVRLRLVPCDCDGWLHCVCGEHDGSRGVCSGDSGGPVLYNGYQIGVTSLGPAQCARAPGGTSVLTALAPYAAVLDATLSDAGELRMHVIARACVTSPPRAALVALAALAALAALCSSVVLLRV
ncbi:trypsin-1-like [Bicyclus anynana]|uniref:Trypsin-1-like n=1 Tax=Bicyclus anynana TaxID=110368 RepID=A0ABM3LDH2_BICAN|nr:trypsin-1-like [Bicyclus anynana]